MDTSFYYQILTIIGINIIIVLGMHIIIGLTGLFQLGQAGFMSIGAYTSAILTLKYGLNFFLALTIAVLVSGILAFLIGYPILRALRGDYFCIATLAFGEIIRVALLNSKISGRALGLMGIKPFTKLYIVFIFVVIGIYIMIRIENSRLGRALIAIREDEIATECMGINVLKLKNIAFIVGCMYAGLGGALYAHFITYINPVDFSVMKSVEFLNMVVIGGMGSLVGSIMGTVLLVSIPEVLRFISQYRMLFYGILMILVMLFRPQGIMGKFKITDLRLFSRFSKEKDKIKKVWRE